MPTKRPPAKIWNRATAGLAFELILIIAGTALVATAAGRWLVPQAPAVEFPIYIAAYAFVIGMIVWRALTFQKQSASLAPWQCKSCGYDMRGMSAGAGERTCPECGDPWRAGPPPTAPPRNEEDPR